MSLSISKNGLALIKRFEGCRLTAYKAVSTEKYWTIGYGHYGSDVKQGQTITQAQADAFLKADCASAEKAVNSYSKYNWNQNQFDALVSFTFNCGSGNLKTLLNNGQRTIAEISSKITAYNKSSGKVLQGLVNRRAAEKELFDKSLSFVTNSIPVISSSNNQSETSIYSLGKINTQSSNLNIRSAPSSTASKVGSYKKGELVYLISKTSNWYKTDKGYISSDYVIIARGKVANCTKLNMRKEPKVETNNVIFILSENDEVYLLEEISGWYKVKTKDNLVGYASSKYITIL